MSHSQQRERFREGGPRRWALLLGLMLLPGLTPGCGGSGGEGYGAARRALEEQTAAIAAKKQMLTEQGYSAEQIAKIIDQEFGDGPIGFRDEVETNASPPERLDELVFVKPNGADPNGQEVRLAELLGKKRIVLIVTRGFSGGMICPFCIAQTRQLAQAYDKFRALNTEVLIVYPGSDEHLPEFLSAATVREQADIADVRWDVVLDPDLSAVKLLDIAADLASPSTFLFDEDGKLALAYVGRGRADRPSVKAILNKIKQLDAE